MNNSLKQQLFDMQAGCSALSWSTQDQKHLWGRNFDFNRLAEGSKISYIPSGTEYYLSLIHISFLKKNWQRLKGKKIAVFCVGASPADEKVLQQVAAHNLKGSLSGLPCFYCREINIKKPRGRISIPMRALRGPIHKAFYFSLCVSCSSPKIKSSMSGRSGFCGIRICLISLCTSSY